jgi:hypothetical protein
VYANKKISQITNAPPKNGYLRSVQTGGNIEKILVDDSDDYLEEALQETYKNPNSTSMYIFPVLGF